MILDTDARSAVADWVNTGSGFSSRGKRGLTRVSW